MKIIPLLILYLFPAFCVAGQDRLPVAVFDFRNRYLSAEQTGKLEREEAGIVDTSNLMGKGGARYEFRAGEPVVDVVLRVLKKEERFMGINYQIMVIRKRTISVFEPKDAEARSCVIAPGDLVVVNDYS